MGSPIENLVFIFEIPFDQRNFERFGIQKYIDNGFNVEVWDLSFFLHPQNRAEVSSGSFSNRKGLIYKKMVTKNEARDELLNVKPSTLVNCFIGFSYRTMFIYRSLSEKRIPYAITVTNAIPTISPGRDAKAETTSLRLLLGIFSRKSNIFLDILDRFVINHFRYLGVVPATLCYAGGQKSIELVNYPFDETTDILWIHTLDYDTYLYQRNTQKDSDNNHGIFLDEYLPFHPDFDMIGESPLVTPEEYYQKVCSFFSYLEKHHNTKIVIAAHPRSDYDRLPDYFEGRTIIKGRTAELVKQSRFVITHASTSINFAILFQKPILFLTMKSLKSETSSCHIGYILDNICSILGKKPISLDDPYTFRWDDEMKVNEETYERYKNFYIKTDSSPEKVSSDIIIDYLKDKKKITI